MATKDLQKLRVAVKQDENVRRYRYQGNNSTNETHRFEISPLQVLRECEENNIKYIDNTKGQIADALTKPLGRNLFFNLLCGW